MFTFIIDDDKKKQCKNNKKKSHDDRKCEPAHLVCTLAKNRVFNVVDWSTSVRTTTTRYNKKYYALNEHEKSREKKEKTKQKTRKRKQ